MREKCPYVFCSAIIESKWMRTSPQPGSERLMVPSHDIKNPIITGACPAGLMWLPLGEHERELLTERAQSDGQAIRQHTEREPETDSWAHRWRRGGLFPITALGPDGVPLRLGREPPTEGPDRDHWFPRRPEDDHPHVLPPHVEGHQQGSRGMASISELVGMTQEANAQTGEALGAMGQVSQGLDNCLGAIERAKSLVSAIVDDSLAQTMSEYRALLESAELKIRAAHGELESVLGDLGAGLERGETFIGNMMG